MSSLIPFVFVAFTFIAIAQIPAQIACRNLEEIKCNCPPGSPGQTIPGEEGPAGLDCVVMQFPDGTYGCAGRDDKRYLPSDIFGQLSYRTNPTKFWWIIATCAVLPLILQPLIAQSE